MSSLIFFILVCRIAPLTFFWKISAAHERPNFKRLYLKSPTSVKMWSVALNQGEAGSDGSLGLSQSLQPLRSDTADPLCLQL